MNLHPSNPDGDHHIIQIKGPSMVPPPPTVVTYDGNLS